MRKVYSPVINLVFYQIVWFGTVLGGHQFIVPLCLLLVLHVYLSMGRREELVVMLVCASIGLLVDIILTYLGLYEFTPSPVGIAVPVWLVVLWLGFAGTFRLAFAFFIKRPPLAIAAAAIGAPLSYLAAGQLGAVSFPYGAVKTALVLAGVWIVLMSVFVRVVRGVESSAKQQRNDAT